MCWFTLPTVRACLGRGTSGRQQDWQPARPRISVRGICHWSWLPGLEALFLQSSEDATRGAVCTGPLGSSERCAGVHPCGNVRRGASPHAAGVCKPDSGGCVPIFRERVCQRVCNCDSFRDLFPHSECDGHAVTWGIGEREPNDHTVHEFVAVAVGIAWHHLLAAGLRLHGPVHEDL